MKWEFEYEEKTDSTLYALHAVAQHWIETELIIENAALEEVEKNGPKWKPDGDDPDSIGEYFFEKSEARYLHDHVLIPMHRNSCIVMLCTTVEVELRRLLKNLESDFGPQKLSLKDIKGNSYLDTVSKFIETFYNIQLSACPDFLALHDLQKIRDCIIHCLGEVALSRDSVYLIKLNKRRKGFFAHAQSDLNIGAECIEQFLIETWNFFIWVFNNLKWKITTRNQGDKMKEMIKKLKPANT